MRLKLTVARHAAAKSVLVAAFISVSGAVPALELIEGTPRSVGAGQQLDVNGILLVGFTGSGQLAVSSGGEVFNSDAYLGSLDGSKGDVTLSGANATWMNSGYLTIGMEGEGVVIVDEGASVIVLDGTDLAVVTNSDGQLSLLGAAGARGVFSTPYIQMGFGDGYLQWDGGVLQARSNMSEFFKNFAHGDIAIGNGGAFFDTNGFNVATNISGIMIGSGGFTKLGAGTLDLAGVNSWNGDTAVLAGTLILDSYSQTGSQSLTIGVAGSTNYGKLSVGGAANFANGNLIVDVIGSPVLANNATLAGVVTAGALTASGFTVADNSALFDFTASIVGNSVDLNVITTSAGTTVYSSVLNNQFYPALGAAGVLDTQIQGTPTGDMANVVTAFGILPDERSVARAAAQTLPLNSGAHATLGVLDTFNAIFAGRIGANDQAAPADGVVANRNVWITPLGSRSVQNDTAGNAAGYSAGTVGLAAGIDGNIGDTQIGFAYGLANTRVDGNSALSGAGTSAAITSNVIALYGSHAFDDLVLGFQVDAGWNGTDSERSVNFGGLNRTASGSFDSFSLHAGGSLSQALNLGETTTFIPMLRADYTRLASQGYSESGAGALNLDVDADTLEALLLGVEGRIVHALSPQLKLDGSVGVSYDAINDSGALTASYAGAPGQNFVAGGIDRSPWTAKAGLGLTYNLNGGADLSVRYDARGWNDTMSHSVAFKAVGRF